MAEQDRGLVSRVGPVEIDWPMTLGYYGGIGIAVAAELIEPPLALFIAAIPFLKMLNRPQAARPTRFVAQFFEGMAKPVGGDSDSAIRLNPAPAPAAARPSLWLEARQVADQWRHRPGGTARAQLPPPD